MQSPKRIHTESTELNCLFFQRDILCEIILFFRGNLTSDSLLSLLKFKSVSKQWNEAIHSVLQKHPVQISLNSISSCKLAKFLVKKGYCNNLLVFSPFYEYDNVDDDNIDEDEGFQKKAHYNDTLYNSVKSTIIWSINHSNENKKKLILSVDNCVIFGQNSSRDIDYHEERPELGLFNIEVNRHRTGTPPYKDWYEILTSELVNYSTKSCVIRLSSLYTTHTNNEVMNYFDSIEVDRLIPVDAVFAMKKLLEIYPLLKPEGISLYNFKIRLSDSIFKDWIEKQMESNIPIYNITWPDDLNGSVDGDITGVLYENTRYSLTNESDTMFDSSVGAIIYKKELESIYERIYKLDLLDWKLEHMYKDIKAISYMKNLRKIDIWNAQEVNLAYFHTLENLEILIVDTNILSEPNAWLESELKSTENILLRNLSLLKITTYHATPFVVNWILSCLLSVKYVKIDVKDSHHITYHHGDVFQSSEQRALGHIDRICKVTGFAEFKLGCFEPYVSRKKNCVAFSDLQLDIDTIDYMHLVDWNNFVPTNDIPSDERELEELGKGISKISVDYEVSTPSNTQKID